MKNLPRDIQEMIVARLDPKSSARLRTVSRDMKAVIDSTRPPTGSYQQKTGRFQKRFSIRGMEQCAKKQVDDFMGMEDVHYHRHFQEYGRSVYKKMKKSYEKNTLFRNFKVMMTSETEDEYWKKAIDIFPEMVSDTAFRDMMRESWQEDVRDKRTFRRRVVRLLKLWAENNQLYTETLKLVRRKKGTYTEEEERTHKDRLMDAIIVQTAVLHPKDDPTRTIMGKNGMPLSLDKKIEMLVKKCSTHLPTTTTRARL